MSLRPGIGAGMMYDLASTLLEFGLDKKLSDVPGVLQHGMKKLPLGRYLRRRLRELIGKEKNAPESAMAEGRARLQDLRDRAFATSTSFQTAILQASLGRRIQVAAKEKRSKKGIRL